MGLFEAFYQLEVASYDWGVSSLVLKKALGIDMASISVMISDIARYLYIPQT